MSGIEEQNWSQSEFWGEAPELPQTFPPVLFGGENHWEKIEEKVILDTTETSSVYPKRPAFFEDLEVGYL